MSLSGHLTILVQGHLRFYFTDPSLTALVFYTRIDRLLLCLPHLSLYMNRYTNTYFLSRITSAILEFKGLEVQKIDFILPQTSDLSDPSDPLFWPEGDLDREKIARIPGLDVCIIDSCSSFFFLIWGCLVYSIYQNKKRAETDLRKQQERMFVCALQTQSVIPESTYRKL